MATPLAPLAFAELAPHSLHVAVLAGRKVQAVRAFGLDAKADVAAFVAEHKIAGVVRASLLGGKNFLHISAESEAGAVRQPSALQAHAGRLPHGFDGAPVAVVCDVSSGLALDPSRAAPWLLAAVDSGAFAAARETLGALGLAPADFTLAAPNHLGVVASSLEGDEVALVVLPGEDEAALAWVSAEGVQAIAAAPLGYGRVFEAVQQGLGLKFRAAAGKLFYNDNYDFADAAPKIAGLLAEALKPALAEAPASTLHIAGLTPGQAWLVQGIASALGLKAWSPSASALAARLGLEVGPAPVFSGAGLLSLAASGSADAAWVQPTLETLIARPPARPKTAAPFAKVSAPAAAPAEAPAAAKQVAPAPAKPVPAPVAAKTAAPAPAAKPVAKPAAKPAPRPAPEPVMAVEVEETAAPVAAEAPVRRGNKGPIFIAGVLVAVGCVAGLAMTMRGQKSRPAVPAENAPAAPAQTAPAAPTPTPSPAPAPVAAAPAPVVAPTPAPAPVAPAEPASSDSFASNPRKFGNDRYRLEVTEKGFIQALATSRDEVLVESAAGVSLQGSYVGTDGRRKWFNVGGVDDAGYQATVKKSVRDGATVFDVKVAHPRFELVQSFVCLPESVKVSARFTPLNLRDPRGVIAAVHSVRLSPVALNPSLRMRPATDGFVYSMKAGSLRVGFDNSAWARDGAEGKQTIVAGENGVAFHFTETTDAARNQLDFTISVP